MSSTNLNYEFFTGIALRERNVMANSFPLHSWSRESLSNCIAAQILMDTTSYSSLHFMTIDKQMVILVVKMYCYIRSCGC